MKLYHATRKSNLDSIMKEGLSPAYYGQIHGAMDYPVAEPCIYLSARATSENLNGNLFSEGAENVIVLEIDATGLDEDRFYCDDALCYIVDQDFLEDVETEEEIAEAALRFAETYGVDVDAVESALGALLEAEDESRHAAVLQRFWKAVLEVDKTVAYAGVISADRILSVTPYEEMVRRVSSDDAPDMF